MTASREGPTGAPSPGDLPPGPMLLAALEATDGGLVVTDLQGRTRYYSQQLVELFGLPEGALDHVSFEEALKARRSRFIRPERFEEVVRQNRADPSSVTEHEFELEDGRIIQRLSRPLRIGGEVAGRVSTIRDVTARRTLERAERRYRMVFEMSPLALAVSSPDGVLTAANDQFEALLGHPARDVVGRNVEELDIWVDERDRAEMLERLPGLIRDYETQLQCADGEFIEAELSVDRVQLDGEEYLISAIQDVTERNLYQRELERQALYDPLTGLPNRNLLFDRLDQADKRAARTEQPFSVLFIDLDQFKAVNTSYGHTVGDRILAEVAARLQDVVREVDTLGRLGGDEFLAVLKDTDVEGARKVARRLLEALDAGRFDVPDGTIGSEASIGIAGPGAERHEPAELIRAADIAMQRAKAGGPHEGPRFAVYQETDAPQKTRLQRRELLRAAIANEELRLHWQPIVDLIEEEVVGAEALVRWEHPEEGLLYPGEFIPMAEESGLIQEIDRWVLRRALTQTREWLSGNGTSPGDLDFRTALNVSPAFYQSPSFVAQVWEALEDAGVAPDRLDLEITERLSVSKTGGWNRIRGSGVRLAVDDFGAGYSSLRYLRQLQADILKVDRYFVTDLDSDDDRASVLAGSILVLGQQLGMGVIAEGVETESQRDRLEELGYRHAQGYYFGRPMPASELQKLPAPADDGTSPTL